MGRRRKKPGGLSYVDPPSDEEIEIEAHATAASSSGGVRQQYSAFCTKFAPSLPEIPVPAMAQTIPNPLPLTESINSDDMRTKKYQGASVMMKAFTEEKDNIQAAILSNEFQEGIGDPCSCGSDKAIFRCEEDCFEIAPLQCQQCIVNQHTRLPFHRIQEWTGEYFKRTSLHILGARIFLGHSGMPCPNRSSTSSGRPFVIVDRNGFHNFIIEFCHCDKDVLQTEPIQLIRARLFPATLDQPESAFTFRLLDDFHAHTLSSKKSSYAYHDALQKRTDAAFPQDVPTRYVEFNRVARVYSHLAAVRRSGQAHNIDSVLTHRRPHSLAVRCPACPEIGVNIDKETIEFATEDEAHKFTLFISADGNFRLQRKNKKGDPDDVALNEGNGYCVDVGPYKAYVQAIHGGDCDDKCICSHLRANRLQNVIKFKNAIVSGVIAIVCARHGFYLPQGMVDLPKGEGYSFTDYALVNSMTDAHYQRWIRLCYDIWCSYGINLLKRVSKHFPASVEIIKKIKGAIPKMHIKNHVELCQLLWAFDYIPHSGSTHGEMIETGWAITNEAAGSTKEMNDGHRHDTLDDNLNYYNWTKFHRIAESLYRAYTNVINTLKAREENFKKFNASVRPDLVKKWEEVDDTPRRDPVTKKVVSVHEAKFKTTPPTQKKAYQALLTCEVNNKLAGLESNCGFTQLINDALHLEHDQSRIIKNTAAATTPNTPETLALVSARSKLQNDLVKFRTTQFNLFPSLQPLISSVDPTTPEREDLQFPSSFSETFRTAYGLGDLAKIEYALREGQAHDALENIRKAIKIFNHNLDIKKSFVFGQHANTRAQGFLKQLAADKVSAADKYRRTRIALLKLGLANNDPVLQELRDDQLWGKDTSHMSQLGDSKIQDPWFWSVGRPSNLSQAEDLEWSIELDRVKWFRERSARNRLREEKEILEEELKRTARSLSYLREIWKTLARRSSALGGVSYAHKQAAMFERLEADCEKLRIKGLEKGAMYKQWFTTTIEGSESPPAVLASTSVRSTT